MKIILRYKGGEGSGFYGHTGRPGEVGGSSSEEGGGNTIKIPDPIKIETPYGNFDLKDIKQLKVVQGHQVIDGGTVKNNGKSVALYVTYDKKPELAAKVNAWKAEWDKYESYKKSEFSENVPGLDELRKAQDSAYNEEQRYQNEFEHMMSNENAVRSPEPIDPNLKKRAATLITLYPRATMYLRAEKYTLSNNLDKYSAGKKAMDIIANGGKLDDAEKILVNWNKADIWT